MLTILENYLELLESLHTGIHQTIEGLSTAALDWTPGPDMSSLAVLVAHIAGSERFWIGDIAGNEPSGRVRETEFQTAGLDEAALAARLDTVLAHSRTVLERLTLAELETKRSNPRDGREYTVAWAVFHALEHTALHVGQMQLTRQLWEQR